MTRFSVCFADWTAAVQSRQKLLYGDLFSGRYKSAGEGGTAAVLFRCRIKTGCFSGGIFRVPGKHRYLRSYGCEAAEFEDRRTDS